MLVYFLPIERIAIFCLKIPVKKTNFHRFLFEVFNSSILCNRLIYNGVHYAITFQSIAIIIANTSDKSRYRSTFFFDLELIEQRVN